MGFQAIKTDTLENPTYCFKNLRVMKWIGDQLCMNQNASLSNIAHAHSTLHSRQKGTFYPLLVCIAKSLYKLINTQTSYNFN